MSEKSYYGSMCITAKVDFWTESAKSIDEVKEELLNLGFSITLCDENGNEIPKEKIEIVGLEGQIIDEETSGMVKESYTDSFEIYEED